MISADKRPPLYGLVLAGGKSLRMGQDKGMMQWHGKPQRYHMADLLANFCQQVFISCRKDQITEITDHTPIPDSVDYPGPIAGILSAFRHDPSTAWLVIACDLPLIDHTTIAYLIEHRDSRAIATTFISPYDGLPEPLITIWEPQSYPILQQYASAGITCPRKVLIRSGDEVKLLQAPVPEKLTNTNTTADAQKVEALLQENAHKNG